MTIDHDIVLDFLKNPLKITDMNSLGNWSNYLTLLHILLVKYDIKKTHLIMLGEPKPRIHKNNIKLSKKLKIFMTHEKPFYTATLANETNFLNRDLILKVVELTSGLFYVIGYSKDTIFTNLTKLNTSTSGSFSEYPDCCISWMLRNQTWDYETAYGIVKKAYGMVDEVFSDSDFVASKLVQFHSDQSHAPILSRNLKIVFNQLEVGRQKFPFCFHQPCDECLKKKDSPTAILNEKYAQFAKKNFPELYDAIITASKIDSEGFKQTAEHKREMLKIYDDVNSEDYPLTDLDDLKLF